MTKTESRVVVAGYDGTQESLRAVFWAAAEADRRKGALVVARALEVTVLTVLIAAPYLWLRYFVLS